MHLLLVCVMEMSERESRFTLGGAAAGVTSPATKPGGGLQTGPRSTTLAHVFGLRKAFIRAYAEIPGLMCKQYKTGHVAQKTQPLMKEHSR